MAKTRIIVRPKKVEHRKSRSHKEPTDYLVQEKLKLETTSPLKIKGVDIPETKIPKEKKVKLKYTGRRKKQKGKKRKQSKLSNVSRETSKGQVIKEREKSKRKKKKKSKSEIKKIEQQPLKIEQQPLKIEQQPLKIEQQPLKIEYIPTVDIFDLIEDYIMEIPDTFVFYRKGHKGAIYVDVQPFKYSMINLVRENSMSDDPEIKKYFIDNEKAIKECIDSFLYYLSEQGFADKKLELASLLNMGHALSSDVLEALELFDE